MWPGVMSYMRTPSVKSFTTEPQCMHHCSNMTGRRIKTNQSQSHISTRVGVDRRTPAVLCTLLRVHGMAEILPCRIELDRPANYTSVGVVYIAAGYVLPATGVNYFDFKF